jgi:hypothetical protein
MIVSTGILIAWGYTTSRSSGHLDLQSGFFPAISALLGVD